MGWNQSRDVGKTGCNGALKLKERAGFENVMEPKIESCQKNKYWSKFPEGSYIFFFFYPVKGFFFSINVKFFLTRIEGLRTEDVVHCTDCKAHWGNVIVILGYINKIDLIWFKLHIPEKST